MNPDLPLAMRRFDLSGRVAIVTGASSSDCWPGTWLALWLHSARVAVVARKGMTG